MRALVIVALLCAPALAAAQPNPAQTPATARPSDAALLRNCDGLFSLPKTYALARNWVDAWNSTSVDRVMGLYAPGFEFRARGILPSNRKSSPDGVLRGQADNRLRW